MALQVTLLGARRRSSGGQSHARTTTSITQAYTILEISSSASEEEVKKSYRTMAKKYHPDRVSALGEEHEKAAKEKFQKVQEAWEVIKENRGFK